MHNDSKVGGILSIVSGIFGILWLLMIVLVIILVFYATSSDFSYSYPYNSDQMMLMVYLIYGIMGIFLAVLGVLAIIGGSFALKRKHWGWALTGAISGTLTFFPCGIAALIFIVKAQSEFNPKPVQMTVSESTTSNSNSISEKSPESLTPPQNPPAA